MTQQSRYSAEETARRGDELYERHIRHQVEKTHAGKVIAIDIDSGSYAIDDNALTASKRLLTQRPDADMLVHPHRPAGTAPLRRIRRLS